MLIMPQTTAPAFLVLALALSWPRFASIFSSIPATVSTTNPLTMVASAVSISAMGLAFSGRDPWQGIIIVLFGLLVGIAMRGKEPIVATAASAISLTIYLRLYLGSQF